MKKFVIIAAFAALLASSGCLQRHVLQIEDHASKPLTLVETLDQYNFFTYPIGMHYRFWTCTDQNDTLNCKVECDGQTDLDCVGFGW